MIRKILSFRFLKSSFVYAVSNALNSAIPFLLIPILTRYLTPSDYGILSIFQVLSTLLVSITGLNTHNAVIVQYYKKDEVDFPTYVFNTLLILLVTVLFLIGISLIFGSPIAELTEFPKEWLPLVVLFSASQFLFQMLLGLWIAEEKPVIYGAFQISQTALNITLSLILVIPYAFGWKGRMVAQVLIFVIYALITLYILVKKGYIKMQLNWKLASRALHFGIPLIPHTFGASVVMLSDRLIISNLVGVNEVGIYMVGFQFAQIILLIQDSVNNAFAPWIYKNLRENKPEQNLKLVKITYIYCGGILVFSILYALLVRPFYEIFVGQDFVGGVKYILWISIAFAFNGMYKMVVNYIFYTEKTYMLAIVTPFTAVINIVLTYVLVSRIGVIGAAYSLCISYLLSFLMTWYCSHKAYPMPWSLKLVLKQ